MYTYLKFSDQKSRKIVTNLGFFWDEGIFQSPELGFNYIILEGPGLSHLRSAGSAERTTDTIGISSHFGFSPK